MARSITAVAAIVAAEATTRTLADAMRQTATDWSKAYAAVRNDRASGHTADAIAKALPADSGCRTAATITDMERAARIDDPASWAALWSLPVRKNGKRIITLHGLVAKARKAYGKGAAAVLDEMIGTATAKARGIMERAVESGDEARGAERVAATYAALVKALDVLTAPATDEDEGTTGEAEVPTGEAVTPDNVQTGTDEEPPTLDRRILKHAGEANALRDILVAGGGMVTRDALTALLRATGDLARDVADILGATPATAAK